MESIQGVLSLYSHQITNTYIQTLPPCQVSISCSRVDDPLRRPKHDLECTQIDCPTGWHIDADAVRILPEHTGQASPGSPNSPRETPLAQSCARAQDVCSARACALQLEGSCCSPLRCTAPADGFDVRHFATYLCVVKYSVTSCWYHPDSKRTLDP